MQLATAIAITSFLLLLGKVFSKLGLSVPDDLLQGVVTSKPGVVEYILHVLKGRVSPSAFLYSAPHGHLVTINWDC